MLRATGASSVDDFFVGVPAKHRLKKMLDIPRGVSEMDLLGDLESLAARNRDCTQQVCFLGGGSYDHFIPTLVDALANQSEFLTAYTPYQAEASQSILQAFYEFQTMICQLTGMEVANASLYEFASAAFEAVSMSLAITRRNKVLVAGSTHPDIRAVIDTCSAERGIEVEHLGAEEGVLDETALASALDERVASVVIQSPNFYGVLERLDRTVPMIHQAGALAIVSTDPIAGGLLKPPGAFDVDIWVGEGKALGVPTSYAVPCLGLLACRRSDLRKLPVPVVGVTRAGKGWGGVCSSW